MASKLTDKQQLFRIIFGLSLLINCALFFGPGLASSALHAPFPDNGTQGFICTDSGFLRATVRAKQVLGENPIGVLQSADNPVLLRYLYPDGTLYNMDDNDAFLDSLGNPASFDAKVSNNPERDAEAVAASYTRDGFTASVVEHYVPTLKGKMYFVSFKNSTYNPHWVLSFRVDGMEMAKTGEKPQMFIELK